MDHEQLGDRRAVDQYKREADAAILDRREMLSMISGLVTDGVPISPPLPILAEVLETSPRPCSNRDRWRTWSRSISRDETSEPVPVRGQSQNQDGGSRFEPWTCKCNYISALCKLQGKRVEPDGKVDRAGFMSTKSSRSLLFCPEGGSSISLQSLTLRH